MRRTWRSGDTVRVRDPFRPRVETALDDPTLQTLVLGPVHLVAHGSATDPLRFGLYRDAALSAIWCPLHRGDRQAAAAHLDGTGFAPFFEGTEDPPHAYVRRAEPRVVFGCPDSGVANPAKPDGATLLDEIWAGAPFARKGALVARVRATVDAWVAAGLPGRADGDRIGATAVRASYVS